MISLWPRKTVEEPKAENRFVEFYTNGLGPIRFVGDDDDDSRVTAAMSVAAFHACVRVLAEGVAGLPFHLLREVAGGSKERAGDHHLYEILHRKPNSWQSSYEFRETLVQHVATWGNAYVLKVYDRSGRVEELVPLHPSNVNVSQLENRALVYDYLPTPDSDGRRFREDQIIHVRYLSDNGYLGMVPLALCGGVIELARSMDVYAQRFWQNDAKPGVILESSQPIPAEALDRMRQSWERVHRGVRNAGRTAVLPNGVTVRELSGQTAEQSQLVELRTFVVQEIARAMRVPCSMIGENSRSTYSNAEQESLNFVQNSLLSWCRRFESAFDRSLLGAMPGYSVSLDVRGLLRGDSTTRAAYYSSLFSLGVLSPNDIRRLEDMPPIREEGADQYFIPTNNFTSLADAAAADQPAEPTPFDAEPVDDTPEEPADVND